MNFKEKFGYMFIGCLFTLAGYFFASLGGSLSPPNTAHAQHNEEVIEKLVCKKIFIVNGDGKNVVVMGTTENDGGFISVRDKDGDASATIATTERAGAIGILNKDGNVTGMFTDNVISLKGKDEAVVGMGMSKTGEGFISLSGKDGKEVVSMGINKGDGGIISVRDKDEDTRAIISVTETSSLMGILNKDEDKIAGAFTENGIFIFNKEEKEVVGIGTNKAGEGFISLSGKDGKKVAGMNSTEADVQGLRIKKTIRTTRPVTTGL